MKICIIARNSFLHQLFMLVLCVTVCLCFLYWWITNWRNHISAASYKDDDIIKLLWWNTTSPVTSKSLCTVHCGCSFSENQTKLAKADAVIFVLDEVVNWHMPLPRAPQQVWALVTVQSPLANLHFIHPEVLQHFNFTATYSQYSNYPLTTTHLPHLHLFSDVYFKAKPVAVKSQLRKRLAPVLFMESDCDTLSARTEYARELMQYIEVDSYGSCLNNRYAPPRLVSEYHQRFYTVALERFIAEYKFILSIEDISCPDFISSLYWEPLSLGVVPIYFGAPNIRTWEPTMKSAVYISEYPNAKALAEYLKVLDSNDDLYMEYLTLQSTGVVQNRRLIDRNAQFHMASKFPRNVILGCAVCDWSCNELFHGQNMHKRTPMLSLCPLQPVRAPIMGEPNESLIWEKKLNLSWYQANALDELIRLNKPFTKEEYEQRIGQHIALADQNMANKSRQSTGLGEILLYK